jgi:hypothetical protein
MEFAQASNAGRFVTALCAADAVVAVHATIAQPKRAAIPRNSRSWFFVVCWSVETRTYRAGRRMV